MSGLWGNQRRRRLFTSPARRRRSVPEWAWIPFAALATVLGLLAALRALGVDIVTRGQYLRPTKTHLAVER